MNEELPKSVMAMRHPDGAVRYADPRSTGIHQTHQHISKEAHRMSSNGPGKPVGPMISTKELPLRERSDRSSSSSASSTSPIKSHKESALQFCLCQPDPKIPRPRNAFILYRQHYQAMVVAHNPGLANPEISKIIGEQWRSLSEEDKSKWKALAELAISSNTLTTATSLGGMVGMEAPEARPQELGTTHLAHHIVTDVVAD
ncbi:transcriptional regulator family: HMG [Penicillium roqueforti]|nr:transcriptional regulator family: HMG [Penicillium roqueforti]